MVITVSCRVSVAAFAHALEGSDVRPELLSVAASRCQFLEALYYIIILFTSAVYLITCVPLICC